MAEIVDFFLRELISRAVAAQAASLELFRVISCHFDELDRCSCEGLNLAKRQTTGLNCSLSAFKAKKPPHEINREMLVRAPPGTLGKSFHILIN